LVEVQLIAAQVDSLADAQAVAEHHEQEQVIANTVPARLRGVEQRGDLAIAEVVLVALVPVRGAVYSPRYARRRG
jgi:hypothetical protein